MSGSSSTSSLRVIAAAIGVSTTTVSNAFNRPERLSAATLERVRAEAARIGYGGPDPVARQLRRGRSDSIGLVLTDELPFAFEDHAAVGFLAGVAQTCEESGRHLVMLSSSVETPPPLATVPIDGLIVYSVADDAPLLGAAQARRLPTVVVDQPHAGKAWDWVGIDDIAVGRAVGEHLAALGHRRVGVVAPRLSGVRRSGPWPLSEAPTYAVLRDRLEGLGHGLAVDGVAPAEIVIEERTISAEHAGASGFEALMNRRPDLTAVFCLSDELALGALTRVREIGLDVPGHVSIVGVDDIDRAASEGLTTVEQPLQAKGAVAGRALMARIDEKLAGLRPARPQRRVLPTTLHVRATTGGARSLQPPS